MHRISHLNPEYVSERLAAVANVKRAWAIAMVVAALTFGMSFIQFA
jgi:hypothetical protein